MILDPVTDEKLSNLQSETEARPVRFSAIETVPFPHTTDVRQFLAFPGTVSVFVARKGSRVIDEIKGSVAQGGEAMARMGARLHQPSIGRKPMSLADAADAVATQPVFAEVRYGGRALVQTMCVPDGFEATMMAFPYNGGALTREGFQLVEFYRDDASYALEAVALVHAPPLTDLQKAALRDAPEELAGMNVGPGIRCYALTATVVLIAATVAATLCCMKTKTAAAWEAAEKNARIPDERVRGMGAAATARQLLALRRRMLREECPAE